MYSRALAADHAGAVVRDPDEEISAHGTAVGKARPMRQRRFLAFVCSNDFPIGLEILSDLPKRTPWPEIEPVPLQTPPRLPAEPGRLQTGG